MHNLELLTRGSELMRLLGSFWISIYKGAPFIASYTNALNHAQLQIHSDLEELVTCLNRHKLPVFHKARWSPYQSIPDLHDVFVITDKILHPSVILIKGLDFDIKDGTINFYKPVFKEDQPIWLFMAEYDNHNLRDNLGCLLNIDLPSSDYHKTLLNLIWDAIIDSPTMDHILQLVAAITDVPLAIDDEIVEEIYEELDRKLIITNKNIYFVPLMANIQIYKGQRLQKGNQLVDAFEILYPYKDKLPDTVSELVLTTNYFTAPINKPLAFPNTICQSDNNNRFPINGDPADIETFWSLVQQNQNFGPINPAEFVLKNILAHNAIIVLLKPTSFGPNAIGSKGQALINQVLPPQSSIIFITLI